MKIEAIWKKALRFVTTGKRRMNCRIKNVPTLLCRDCIAGVMYHDLSLQFLSPTINLYMHTEDFLKFATHLLEYKNEELVEKPNSDKPFPVGVLRHDELGNIEIFFMHYTSFSQAKTKWEERCRRMDLDNIVVVLPLLSEGERVQQLLNGFQRLPYKKVALVTEEYAGQPNTFAYSKEMFDPNGEENLLSYRKNNGLLQWRYLDYFDYGSFLKNGEIKERRI